MLHKCYTVLGLSWLKTLCHVAEKNYTCIKKIIKSLGQMLIVEMPKIKSQIFLNRNSVQYF